MVRRRGCLHAPVFTNARKSIVFFLHLRPWNTTHNSHVQSQFYGRKRRHIVEQILNGQFDFRGRRWKRISSQAKAFVEELLVLDPEERSDAHMALRSTWLNRGFSATARGPDAEEESMARHAMLRYSGYTKLKKMVS